MDISVFGILIAIIIVFLYHLHRKKFNYWKSRKVPFLKPTPIFGNTLPYTLNKMNYHQLIEKLYKSVSDQPYIGAYQMMNPILLICDPKLSNEIAVKNYHSFEARDLLWFSRIQPTLNPLSDNIVSQSGPRWKCMRQKLSLVFVSTKGRKILFEYAMKGVNELITFLDNPSEDLNMTDACTRLMITIISPWVLGAESNSFKQENCQILTACRKTLRVNFVIRYLLYGIHPKLLDLFGLPDFNRKSVETFISLIRESIEYRKKNNIRLDDLLDVLIDITNSSAPSEMGNEKFDEHDIFGNIFMIFMAGSESSMSTLLFTLFELSLNNEIQEKVREEINSIWDRYDGKIDFDTLNEMKYTEMVISESMRKYPADAVIFRKCTEKFYLPQTDSWIEPNTSVLLPVYGFHHDPKYYPEPEKFIPERFSPENKSSIPNGAYIPFGEGPRICIGMRAASTILKLAIFEILRNYELSVSDKTRLPLNYLPGLFTLAPKNDIWLKVNKLRK